MTEINNFTNYENYLETAMSERIRDLVNFKRKIEFEILTSDAKTISITSQLANISAKLTELSTIVNQAISG